MYYNKVTKRNYINFMPFLNSRYKVCTMIGNESMEYQISDYSVSYIAVIVLHTSHKWLSQHGVC